MYLLRSSIKGMVTTKVVQPMHALDTFAETIVYMSAHTGVSFDHPRIIPYYDTNATA